MVVSAYTTDRCLAFLTGFLETVGLLVGELLDEEAGVAAEELAAVEELAGLFASFTMSATKFLPFTLVGSLPIATKPLTAETSEIPFNP